MAKQKLEKNILSGSPRITKVSLGRRLSAFFYQHFQQIFISFRELWNTPFSTMMTILVLGVALSLPAVFHVLQKNVERASGQWNKASEISLFLKKDISEQRVQVLINKLGLYSEIETVTHITNHQALEEFKEMSGFSKALNYLDENPLPDVLVIVPAKQAMTIAASKLLVAKLKREQDVDLVQVDIDWIEKLQSMIGLVVDVMMAIALLLLLSVFLVVSNTIRLNILNQRAEIEVMKLVGATNSFIQRPFVYVGIWYGLLGGIIAWVLTLLLVQWIHSGVASLMDLYRIDFEISILNLREVAILVGLSSFLGFIASYISVKRYLVKIEPK